MIEALVRQAKTYIPDLNEARLCRAFAFAVRAHTGQVRKDGTPYISHPLKAAEILTQLHVDEDTLIACLLHDVPEDTSYTLEDIEDEFGSKVSFLVDGITKLSKVHYRNDMVDRQIESLKKLFIHSAQDPRIILIKLADRLHNMQTLDAIPKPEKRERIARETLEIFVPIANLLGIWELKNQLEDHCFRILWPSEYEQIRTWILDSIYKKENVLKKTIQKVKILLKSKRVSDFTIEGRQKNLYSIYKKMLRTGKSFHDIYDLIGVRIILPDVGACYQVLGVLHQHFTPKIGRLKDYIAIPKNNGYQSIHTTVFGLDGVLTEFQIRTFDMHLENEYGIAAHYFYTTKRSKKRDQMKRKVAKKYRWVQQILDLQRNIPNNQKFLEDLKLDIFEDRIFVFTPKGDVIDLPIGSNCIDFAYQIHSDLGMLATKATINGKAFPLTTRLNNGDIVHIQTSEASEGPQVDWLDSVRTNLARNRIREFLKERDRTILVQQAEHWLDQKLLLLGFGGVSQLTDLQKLIALHHFNAQDWEDLLLKIGQGTASVRELILALFTKEELFGQEKAPSNVPAYGRLPRRNKGRSEILQTVHHISIVVEGENRVGLLRDLSNALANLGINIIMVQSLPRIHEHLSRIGFIFEIVDLDQYERTMMEIRKVEGVSSVFRLPMPQVNEVNSNDVRTKHEQ